MKTEVNYTIDDFKLFMDMFIGYVGYEEGGNIADSTHVFSVFSDVITDSINNGPGREVEGHELTNHDLEIWNHAVISYLVNNECDEPLRQKVMCMWFDIQIIIRGELRKQAQGILNEVMA